jgi:hypothetical protein
MTQTIQTVRQVFAGDDSADPLTIVIPFFNPSDLIVAKVAAGAQTTLVNGVDYTVAGGKGQGGTVTPLAAIPVDTDWVVVRSLPLTQPIDFENTGTILPSAIEEAVDRLLLMHLDNDDTNLRTIQADDAEIDPTGLRMPDLATRAEQLLKWEADGSIGVISPGDVIPGEISVSEWGESWVGLSNYLQARLELNVIFGTLVAMSNADKSAGSVFMTTDTLEIYMANGSSYDLMSASQETTVKPNLIINGSAQINQRVTCNSTSTYPNNDFGLSLDHVFLVSEGNNIATVVQDTDDAPDGSSHCFKLASVTTNKKYGLLFPLAADLAANLLSAGNDKKASLRFKYKGSAAVANIRAYIMSYTGTVDELVDPIDGVNWGGFEELPDLHADWHAENNAALIPVTTEWQTKEIADIAIDTADATNVGVFIWVDDSHMIGGVDTIYLADIHLNEGPALAPYTRPSFTEEWDACTRFMQKSFPYSTQPGQNRDYPGCLALIAAGTGQDRYGVQVRFQRPMHKEPAVTFFSPKAASAYWYDDIGNSSEGGVTKVYGSDSGFFAKALNTGAMAIRDVLTIHYAAIAELIP